MIYEICPYGNPKTMFPTTTKMNGYMLAIKEEHSPIWDYKSKYRTGVFALVRTNTGNPVQYIMSQITRWCIREQQRLNRKELHENYIVLGTTSQEELAELIKEYLRKVGD